MLTKMENERQEQQRQMSDLKQQMFELGQKTIKQDEEILEFSTRSKKLQEEMEIMKQEKETSIST